MQGRSRTAPPSPRRKGRQMERDTSTITTATNSVFHSRLQENNNNIKWVVESVKRITLFWSAVFFPGMLTERVHSGRSHSYNATVTKRTTTRTYGCGRRHAASHGFGRVDRRRCPRVRPVRTSLLASPIGASRKRARNSVASTRDVLGTASWQPVRRTSPGTWLAAAGGVDVTGAENGI